jgi:beta-phosphoglucomutase
MNKIKVVIFDMDGVLIDAREWHYEALNRALNMLGYNISRYDHLVTFDGLPTSKKLEMLSREHGLPAKLHSFLNELKQVYTRELINTNCKPRFQHEFALSRLKKDGYILGLASNSIRSTIDLMMEKSALSGYLNVIVSNQDVSKAKPDPEIYHKAMALLSVSPCETLVIEDNPHGIAAARASGAHVMVVSDPNDVTHDRILEAINQSEQNLGALQ